MFCHENRASVSFVNDLERITICESGSDGRNEVIGPLSFASRSDMPIQSTYEYVCIYAVLLKPLVQVQMPRSQV